MGELRNNDGPDDGDTPADEPAVPDKPAERPRFEIRSADMNKDWPVRRHLVTPAQREYIRTGAADALSRGGPVKYSMDWESGESLDHRYLPPLARDRARDGDATASEDDGDHSAPENEPDRTPDDSGGPPGGGPPDPPDDGPEEKPEPDDELTFPENEGGWRGENSWMVFEENITADHNIDRVREAEEDISTDLRTIESEVGGAEMVGWDRRRKEDDRLKDKIAQALRDNPEKNVLEVIDQIPDAIRYTYQFEAEDYTRGYFDVCDRLEAAGYRQEHCRNSWDSPDYKGVNTRWRSPEGQLFEIQFHTPESHETKERTHGMYEVMRARDVSDEEYKALAKAQAKLVARLSPPPGVERIETFRARR